VAQPALHDHEQRIGYRLKDVATGEERPFAVRHSSPGSEGLGYEFDPDGWLWAQGRIHRAPQKGRILVVDELGRLEAVGKGHMPALEAALASGSAEIGLVSARADCLADIQRRLGRAALLLPAGSVESARELVDRILELFDAAETAHQRSMSCPAR